MTNDSLASEGPRRVALGKGADVWVEGSGDRLLLVHGWGLRPHVFRSTIGHLAGRGFEVAAPSIAVVGRQWDLERAVHRCRKTLDALEWDKAIVVGYSLGGAVATGLASAHSERVRLLGLVNSIGLRINRRVLGWAGPISRYARMQNLGALRAFGHNALQFRGLQNLADAARYARVAHLDEEIDRVRLARISTVVLWGANDRLLPVDMGRDLAEALGAPLHVVPNADHDWPVRSPDLFARELDLLLRASLFERKRVSARRRPKRAARRGTP